ncbi:uncharacterized protein LOC110807682 [Carica papaya]|uniref:uncharacterized protein LOC110807682 n=1 Tax=Carica papaya TaxID=3649 RepID=UPI000B8CCAC4|nr:uncharacterized protein LOC110807682 [Carica papaya]
METSAPIALFILLLLSIETAAARSGLYYTRTRGTCTPRYWSNRVEEWPRMVPQTSTVRKVFGSGVSDRYRLDLTLLESTARNEEDNAFGRLVKQASAALLNSYARQGFPYSPWQVKTMVIESLVSEEAAANLAQRLFIVNRDCN